MTDQNGTQRDDDRPETVSEDAAEDSFEAEELEAEEALEQVEETDQDSLLRELADTTDKLKRALAEMENLRRRAQKEREDTAKFAISNFARDVLPVADNLRRALDAVPPEGGDAEAAIKILVEGVELTERDLLTAFERHGIVKIDPLGEKFDHRYHEAMFEVPTAEAPPGTIVQVMEVGYLISERLLRPARVGIAKALPESGPQERVDTTV